VLKLDFNVAALTAQVENMGKIIKESERPVAKAGAQVYYDEVQIRAQQSGGNQLRDAVYQYFVKGSGDGTPTTYHISWRKQRNRDKKGEPPSSMQMPWSTIGYWMEFGRIAKYVQYQGTDGNWYTAAKPENRGKTPPWVTAGRKGPRPAEADKWYQHRKGGPLQIAPRPFIRPSYDSKRAAALEAAKARLVQLINGAQA
jgi:hypothetical protein